MLIYQFSNDDLKTKNQITRTLLEQSNRLHNNEIQETTWIILPVADEYWRWEHETVYDAALAFPQAVSHACAGSPARLG